MDATGMEFGGIFRIRYQTKNYRIRSTESMFASAHYIMVLSRPGLEFSSIHIQTFSSCIFIIYWAFPGWDIRLSRHKRLRPSPDELNMFSLRRTALAHRTQAIFLVCGSTSETALLDLNLTRCEQTLVPRSHVLISQLKVYAIFKRNKDFQFVDAARRKKMSLVRHVEETLVAEYAMALV